MALQTVNNNNITGARCVFLINGQVVALARSVSYSFSYDYSEVRVLNNLRVFDHVPVSYRASVSFGMFRVPKQSLTTMGFYPQTGATASDQLTNVLTIPALTCVVVDTVSGAAIATITGVKIAGGSFTLDAGGNILASDVDCVCLAIYDESEIAPAS